MCFRGGDAVDNHSDDTVDTQAFVDARWKSRAGTHVAAVRPLPN
jgi:hypothetical protein